MTDVQETGSRARTRQAIVDAAVDLLGQNPSATLGEIAAAAQVGRTTLHRYFAERSDLLAAVSAEGVARIERAGALARLDQGTGGAALARLCREYFDLGPLLSLIFTEPSLIDTACAAEGAIPFEALVARGHRDGSIDPELPADWVQNLLWSQLYTGWSYQAQSGASRHQVLHLVVRSLTGSLTPR